MSEIIQKITGQAGKAVAQADDKTSLLASYKAEEILDEVRLFMTGDQMFQGVPLPRFGVLSLLLQQTPTYCYNLPALRKICKTAFTDGIHIFICEDFLNKLEKDVENSKGQEYGIEPLLMHELMHKLLNHTNRLRQFGPVIANKAEDLSINTKLQLGWPEMKWARSLRETGLGFKPGDVDKYAGLAEETIARELLNQELKKKQQQGQGQGQQQGGGQGQQQGQGQGQGQQQGQGQGQQQGQGQGQPGQGQPGQGGGQPDPNGQGGGQPGEDNGEATDEFGQDGDNHTVSPEELIKILEDEGLDNVIEKLGLPKSSDIEKIGEMQEEAMMRQIEAVQKASAQMSQNGGKYPGAHIVDAAADMIQGFAKGKLSWRLALREALIGDGTRWQYNDEEPGDPYYVEAYKEAAGVEFYIGQDLPHKPQETVLCLFDTSGSVSQEDIRAFLNEVFELKTATSGFSDQASEIIVLSADTVIRGEPIEITEENVDQLMGEGVKIFGRGGTDLCHSLQQTLALPLMEDKNIKSIVYFTDLYDTPPRLEDLIKAGMKEGTAMVYVAAPSTHSSHCEEFARAVESYARVVEINEGNEVDLTEDFRNSGSKPR